VSTAAPTTVPPTTAAPTTLAPTTLAPTTLVPTTAPPTGILIAQVLAQVEYVAEWATTAAPTTTPPTTLWQSTAGPTTVAPTTLAPTTLVPTTQPPCGTPDEVWSKTLTTDFSNFQASYRNILAAASIADPGVVIAQVRVRFSASSANQSIIEGASIGLRLGASISYQTGKYVRLLFSGLNGVTIPAGATAWSDWVDFAYFDPDVDHLVHIDVGTVDVRRMIPGGDGCYYKAGDLDDVMIEAPIGYSSLSTSTFVADILEVDVECITSVPPTTTVPTTLAPTTLGPTTLGPTTLAPTTLAPTTVVPTTLVPTTLAPTTIAPTTIPPTTPAPGAICIRDLNSCITNTLDLESSLCKCR